MGLPKTILGEGVMHPGQGASLLQSLGMIVPGMPNGQHNELISSAAWGPAELARSTDQAVPARNAGLPVVGPGRRRAVAGAIIASVIAPAPAF